MARKKNAPLLETVPTLTLALGQPPRSLKVAGLFAGIGGIEVGLARHGHHTALLCEIEPGARAVLEARFPGIPLHDDVTTLEGVPEGTDLLVAGFPCQDLSQAGRTVGISGDRSGLVDHVFRLVESLRVPYVLLENVPFMLQLDRGEAMNYLVRRFEGLGYRWAYRVVDTRSFGLPQRRRRVCFLASLVDDPADVLLVDDAGIPRDAKLGGAGLAGRVEGLWHGFYWTEGLRGLGWAVDAVPTLKGGSTIGIPSPPAIWLDGDRFGTPDIRDSERLQGFDAGWTEPATARVRESHRWKLVGNAVSVGMADWLGRRLAQPGRFDRLDARALTAPPWPTAAWGAAGRRFTANISEWPVALERPHLHEFLRHEPKPLSTKAANGFLERISRSTLRLPDGFVDALRRYIHGNQKASNTEHHAETGTESDRRDQRRAASEARRQRGSGRQEELRGGALPSVGAVFR